MAKKKKSLTTRIVNFFKLIFNVIKWIIKKIWGFFKWVFSIFKKANKKRRDIQIDNERPGTRAEFNPLKAIESKEDIEKFEEVLYSNKSTIGLILGSRGAGKSALGMKILENVVYKTKRKACCMGFDIGTLPKWIKSVKELDEVQNNSFLLVDEGGIEFSSRNSMSNSNKLLSSLLFISRHKDISVLFISQNSANIEINTIRQSDYLLLKKPSLLQLDFERKVIKQIYAKAKEGFEKYSQDKGLVYLYSNQFQGFASNTLPSFWNEEISRSYKNIKK
ncbi:hypothetical protein KO465_00330 [Candidatus Micrarchaeota archaeon]|nr:hypothetical protein [Candidatus Micrarchaeota archaeon]